MKLYFGKEEAKFGGTTTTTTKPYVGDHDDVDPEDDDDDDDTKLCKSPRGHVIAWVSEVFVGVLVVVVGGCGISIVGPESP